MRALPRALTSISSDAHEVRLPLRELLVLDKASQTTRGELVNNLAKLSEIDKEIKDIHELYESARDRDDKDEQVVDDLRQQLREKQDVRSARLEVVSTNERVIRSQINRIKETIYRMLEKDVTPRDNINTLFREQGVTIVSILTSISLAISTIVASIVASVRPI